jgi:hypothetical protein
VNIGLLVNWFGDSLHGKVAASRQSSGRAMDFSSINRST